MTGYVVAAMLGVLGGFVAAIAGVGGGVVFVPALALVLGLSQVVAEATSLLAIVPVAAFATWQQRRTGEVRFGPALAIGIAAVPSAIGAAILAHHLPDLVLRTLFAVLLVLIAVRVWRGARDPVR
jgi:uncharacterized protein